MPEQAQAPVRISDLRMWGDEKMIVFDWYGDKEPRISEATKALKAKIRALRRKQGYTIQQPECHPDICIEQSATPEGFRYSRSWDALYPLPSGGLGEFINRLDVILVPCRK